MLVGVVNAVIVVVVILVVDVVSILFFYVFFLCGFVKVQYLAIFLFPCLFQLVFVMFFGVEK